MARIDLTEREQSVLQKVLESYLRELRGEITHTDARGVRSELKDEEEVLRQILGRLTHAAKSSR